MKIVKGAIVLVLTPVEEESLKVVRDLCLSLDKLNDELNEREEYPTDIVSDIFDNCHVGAVVDDIKMLIQVFQKHNNIIEIKPNQE